MIQSNPSEYPKYAAGENSDCRSAPPVKHRSGRPLLSVPPRYGGLSQDLTSTSPRRPLACGRILRETAAAQQTKRHSLGGLPCREGEGPNIPTCLRSWAQIGMLRRLELCAAKFQFAPQTYVYPKIGDFRTRARARARTYEHARICMGARMAHARTNARTRARTRARRCGS